MHHRLRITLWDDADHLIREQDFVGTSAEDLAMLGAAKGYLEGLYETGVPDMKEKALMSYADKMLEMLKPKERAPMPPLPPIRGIPVQDLTAKGANLVHASTFERTLRVEFASDAALQDALGRLDLVRVEPVAPEEPGSPT